MLTPFHDPKQGKLRVIGLMSGSGTNLRRILEHERQLETQSGASPFELVGIFSDNHQSNANQIGADFSIPVVTSDLRSYCRAKGRPHNDLEVRAEFDALTVRLLAPFEATVAAYAGYMSIATQPLINAFCGVNVHPADLSLERGGQRRFVGAHPVRDAILAGEKTLCSSTHMIEETVDGGRILMISAPLQVQLGDDFDNKDRKMVRSTESHNQDRLKEAGDWVVFPRTLQNIAEGRFAVAADGTIHFDGKPIPEGLRLSS